MVIGGCAGAAGLALLAACSVGPKYVRPSMETPAAYKEDANWKVAQPRDNVRRDKWWEVFGDAQLNDLVSQIDISNQNVRLAEANFRQARTLVQQARASLFPSVTGNVAVERSRSPGTSTRGGAIANSYNLSLDASYEVDLWGRVRNTVSANSAGAQASAADLETARLLAQAELAFDYFQLRVLDQQRQLLDDTVAAFQKSLELTRNRYTAGVAGKVDLVQAEQLLRTTQAQGLPLHHARSATGGSLVRRDAAASGRVVVEHRRALCRHAAPQVVVG